jgi:hypothetical protein
LFRAEKIVKQQHHTFSRKPLTDQQESRFLLTVYEDSCVLTSAKNRRFSGCPVPSQGTKSAPKTAPGSPGSNKNQTANDAGARSAAGRRRRGNAGPAGASGHAAR